MAYTTLQGLFTGICDALRTKKNTTALINHQDIPNEILNLPSGATVDTRYGEWTSLTQESMTWNDVPNNPKVIMIYPTSGTGTSGTGINQVFLNFSNPDMSSSVGFIVRNGSIIHIDNISAQNALSYNASTQQLTFDVSLINNSYYFCKIRPTTVIIY